MIAKQPGKVDVEVMADGDRVILRIYGDDGDAIVELTMGSAEAADLSARLSTCAYAVAFGGSSKCADTKKPRR